MLRSITGSRARAAILAELLGDDARPHSVSELARLAGVQRSAALKEVRHLVRIGLLRPALPDRRQGPLFEAAVFPGHLDLRRFVVVAHGHAGRIRAAVEPLDPRQLVWIHGHYAEARTVRRQIRIAALTADPRRTRERVAALASELGMELAVDAMTSAEWARRLERREMRVLAIRRATRLWLIGSDELLRALERSEAQDHATWKKVLANWREEAEWDEDWDPFAPVLPRSNA